MRPQNFVLGQEIVCPKGSTIIVLSTWLLAGAILYYLFCAFLIGTLSLNYFEAYPQTFQDLLDQNYTLGTFESSWFLWKSEMKRVRP